MNCCARRGGGDRQTRRPCLGVHGVAGRQRSNSNGADGGAIPRALRRTAQGTIRVRHRWRTVRSRSLLQGDAGGWNARCRGMLAKAKRRGQHHHGNEARHQGVHCAAINGGRCRHVEAIPSAVPGAYWPFAKSSANDVCVRTTALPGTPPSTLCPNVCCLSGRYRRAVGSPSCPNTTSRELSSTWR